MKNTQETQYSTWNETRPTRTETKTNARRKTWLVMLASTLGVAAGSMIILLGLGFALSWW